MSKNYYDVLGISPDAKPEDIRPAAQAKANEINDAFATLIDPEKRKAYDEQLDIFTQVDTINEKITLEKEEPSEIVSPTSNFIDTKSKPPPLSSPFRKQKKTNPKWGQRWEGIKEKLTTIETPSIRDIVVFIMALAFFIYMVSGFFVSPSIERDETRAAQMQKYQGR